MHIEGQSSGERPRMSEETLVDTTALYFCLIFVAELSKCSWATYFQIKSGHFYERVPSPPYYKTAGSPITRNDTVWLRCFIQSCIQLIIGKVNIF